MTHHNPISLSVEDLNNVDLSVEDLNNIDLSAEDAHKITLSVIDWFYTQILNAIVALASVALGAEAVMSTVSKIIGAAGVGLSGTANVVSPSKVNASAGVSVGASGVAAVRSLLVAQSGAQFGAQVAAKCPAIIIGSAGMGLGATAELDAGAALWTPAELGSLVMWLDAMDENSVVYSIDSVITQLQDKSTANNHFYPVTGIPAPLYSLSTSISNNKPAIVFPDDGNARYVQAASAFNLKEVFYVCAYKDGLASTFARYDALLSGTKQYGAPRIIGDLNTNRIRLDDTKFGDYVYKNGSTTHSITVLPMPLSILRVKSNTLHNYAWSVGGLYGYTDVNHWKGVICEVIGFSSNPTADEAQKVEGYLAHKWELAGELPIDHPYKNSPPMALIV